MKEVFNKKPEKSNEKVEVSIGVSAKLQFDIHHIHFLDNKFKERYGDLQAGVAERNIFVKG